LATHVPSEFPQSGLGTFLNDKFLQIGYYVTPSIPLCSIASVQATETGDFQELQAL
jgi:hypothetical protein